MGVNLRGGLFSSSPALEELLDIESLLLFDFLLLPYVVAMTSGLNLICGLFAGSALSLLLFSVSSTSCGANFLGFGFPSSAGLRCTSFEDFVLVSTGSGANRLTFVLGCSSSFAGCFLSFDDLTVSSTGSGAKRLGFAFSSLGGDWCREDLEVCSIGVGANFLGGAGEAIENA